MKEWFDLSEADRREVIVQTSISKGLQQAAIEKDWWVVAVLRALFATKYADHLVFKGGTSLSKAWGLIERFSEDIDLGMDKSYFGFKGTLSRKKVKKLRQASCKFVSETLPKDLEAKLHEMGVKDFTIHVRDFEESDTDPLAIEIRYKSLVEKDPYLEPRILVEISSRSLRDPFEVREVISFIGDRYKDQAFADKAVNIPTVLPQRTFLEKLFLLHEEFQKPKEKGPMRSHRMTRHLYDISRMMDTEIGESAIKDHTLYSTIVEHRQIYARISWIDYSKHARETLDFIPPKKVLAEWEEDYKAMQESMFYGKTETFEDLLHKLKGLRDSIRVT
ncbi:nucleotidyl transferase AbiEii/AbiGii toxin family protein [Flagellimonas sp.]|uniref:nucleotidyl transferase AbiEii/AbiGii toxin family protein n=1 Tax=Flagellimonas sp. TaxID=2058762 RepID=UPI003BAD6168